MATYRVLFAALLAVMVLGACAPKDDAGKADATQAAPAEQQAAPATEQAAPAGEPAKQQ